ncbi:MAG TPA: alpha/beta hydrolase [Longimicrobium sp.]|jgi:pimeloyl-ACP methyl ester carboxylesterase|uniref:alpha/beta fold hydrolase n=1 Tax=Longimicrobium sp. TaxID=2029185 RepID=UPI002ED8BE2B
MGPIADGADLLTIGGVRLECRWIGPGPDEAPTIVFLHEGLGSVSTWRGFPQALTEVTGCGALVYSRAGYGRSEPVVLPRPVEFMHREAEVLDEVLRAANVRRAVLFGHSDGASIALIHAGSHPSDIVAGLVLEAPHVFVEDVSVDSIAQIGDAYRSTDLRERLARHHQHVDVAFWGWNGVWLDPDFRAWNIEHLLPSIRVPALVIQGEADEYGTWAQVESIQRLSGGPVDVLRIADCGHAPHVQHPGLVMDAATRFIGGLLRVP